MKHGQDSNVIQLVPRNRTCEAGNHGPINIQNVFKEYLPLTVVAVLFFLGVVGYGLFEFASALVWVLSMLGQ
jgi:hypothetical protein